MRNFILVILSLHLLGGYVDAATVTTFRMTSGATGTLPFSIGVGFKKGDVPSELSTDATTWQYVVKRRWNDGSVKHAIISGTQALTNGVPTTITVSTAGSAPGGTPLTCTDIQTASPSASVQAGAIGTVNLSSLLASPFRTWISGPEMVECHYRSQIGSDASLVAWFHVRLWSNGTIWIRAIVQNGYLNVSTSDKSYVPTITINGSTVYNNSGAALSHYAHTRYVAEGWIGTDPQITSAEDPTYLINSKLVPNYWKRNPSSAALDELYQTYIPMDHGGWTINMGDQGYQDQIGLLPLWDALFVTSGDARAYRSVLANAKALSSYPLVWKDSSTHVAPIPTDRPLWTVNGNGGGGENGWGAGGLNWEYAHHGSGGYLAYLITGDYYFLETMMDQAALIYLVSDTAKGSGTSRIIWGQIRANAWGYRTVGQLVSIGPTSDSVVADYRTLLSNNADYWLSKTQLAGQNLLGYLFTDGMPNDTGVTGSMKPWMQHFWIQANGYVSDLEPLSSMTNWDAVRDWMYKGIVGILGPNGTDYYCYTKASAYSIVVAAANSSDPTTWYDSWGTVHQSTYGSPNNSCGTTLEGSSGGNPAAANSGYWGNLLPAIAYAVDHNATGAVAAWNRLTSTTNWNTDIETSASPDIGVRAGFDDTPIWGIVPRSIPAGTGWYPIPNTHLRSVAPANNFGGSGYNFTSFIPGILAYSGGVFDSLRNRLIIFGGGHSDYSGNEIYALDLDTLILSRLTDPGVPIADSGNPDSIVGGTQPNSRHTYDGIEYMPNIDKMFLFGGSPAPGGNFSNGTWLFNFATNLWEVISPSGTIPNTTVVKTAYDPNTGKIFLHDNVNLFTFTAGTNTYVRLTNNGSDIDYHMNAVIDPVRKKFMFIGGGQAWIYDISDGSSYTKTALSMTGATTLRDCGDPGLAYDSQNDRMTGWCAGDTVYYLNLDTLTWTSADFPIGPTAAHFTGTYGRWQYSPTSGVFVLLNDVDKDILTLRVSAQQSNPTTPPAPTNTGGRRVIRRP